MKEQVLFERILSSPNFSNIIVFIAADICEYLSCERITIYQKGRDDDEIVSRFKTGSEFKEIRIPLGTGSIAGYVALSHQPLYFKDVYRKEDLQKIHPNLAFDRSFDKFSGFRTRSLITVPIKNHNVLLGVLQVLNKVGGDEFSNNDAVRVILLAEVIAKKFAKDLESTQNPYELLIRDQLINEDQLEDVQARAAKARVHPSMLLIDEFHIDPIKIGKSLENFYQVPYLPYDPKLKLPEALINKLSETYIRKQLCLPISGNTHEACITIEDPTDHTRILELQKVLEIENVIIRLSLPIDILHFLGGSLAGAEPELSAIVEELKEDDPIIEEDPYSIDNYSLGPDAAPIIKLVHKIIVDAVKLGASDIHIEAGKEKTPTIVRMRVDGLCREIEKIPAQYGPALLSRIKVISRLDISEHRKPQDGKCKVKFGTKIVELRVAIIPTVNGECAVLRVLSHASALPMDKLNLSARNKHEIIRLVEHTHGIFLVVGPTGSGKTTTLHALLGHLNTPEKKIWTAEDPVEITQAGLQQVQVIPKIGLDFATLIRSFLRADPDVILIGEIRDRETAHIAIEASLTGHLVFSTLHTNSAAETLVRLLDLGLDPLNFADALQGVLAQRLMRVLCKHCKAPYHPDADEFVALQNSFGAAQFDKLDFAKIKQNLLAAHSTARFENLDTKSEQIILFKAVGCEECDHTGFKGRVAIHELLIASPTIKLAVSKRAAVNEIRNLAVQEGMVNLMQDGILKILAGFSDLHQLHRVVNYDA